MPEYEAWREGLTSTAGWDIKYYKARSSCLHAIATGLAPRLHLHG